MTDYDAEGNAESRGRLWGTFGYLQGLTGQEASQEIQDILDNNPELREAAQSGYKEGVEESLRRNKGSTERF